MHFLRKVLHIEKAGTIQIFQYCSSSLQVELVVRDFSQKALVPLVPPGVVAFQGQCTVGVSTVLPI